LVTRSPGQKSSRLSKDLDLYFAPLDLSPEALGLCLLGFAGGQRLG
jgi:hypothetical protein